MLYRQAEKNSNKNEKKKKQPITIFSPNISKVLNFHELICSWRDEALLNIIQYIFKILLLRNSESLSKFGDVWFNYIECIKLCLPQKTLHLSFISFAFYSPETLEQTLQAQQNSTKNNAFLYGVWNWRLLNISLFLYYE